MFTIPAGFQYSALTSLAMDTNAPPSDRDLAPAPIPRKDPALVATLVCATNVQEKMVKIEMRFNIISPVQIFQ